MSGLVLAQGFDQFIVPLLVFAFYIAAQVLKSMAERKPKPVKWPAGQAPPRPPADQPMVLEQPVRKAPPRVPPPRVPDPQKDLERMLEELKLRRPEKKPPTPPPLPKRPRKQPSTVEPVRPSAPDSKRAVSRELHSGLERRHAEQVHSGIEGQHLASHVGARSSTESSVIARPGLPIATGLPGQIPIADMVSSQSLLRNAFILGVVLGPPLSAQNQQPLR